MSPRRKPRARSSIYTTDPEQGTVKLLDAFRAVFPKIKTNYIRLQAGALYAKLLSERQARSFLVDAMQISDMGLVLDFQKRGGYRPYVSPEMSAYKPEYKSQPEGFWTWGAIIMAGIAYNPTVVPKDQAPKTWEDVLDPKWADGVSVKVSNSGLQHETWFELKRVLGPDYFKKFADVKPRAFDSYVQQYQRAVNGEDKIIHTAQYSGYLEFKAKGAPIEFVYSRRRTPCRTRDLGPHQRRPASQCRRALPGLVPLGGGAEGLWRRALPQLAARRRAAAAGRRLGERAQAALPGRLERVPLEPRRVRPRLGPHHGPAEMKPTLWRGGRAELLFPLPRLRGG